MEHDSQDALEGAIWTIQQLFWELKWMTEEHKRVFLKFVRDLMEAELKQETSKQRSKAERKTQQ